VIPDSDRDFDPQHVLEATKCWGNLQPYAIYENLFEMVFKEAQ
jgi:hypothetical protein